MPHDEDDHDEDDHDEDDAEEDQPDEPEDDMDGPDEPEYTIVIDYEDFITRLDLDEILGSIDRIIEAELLDYYDPEFRYIRRRYPYPFSFWEHGESELSYVGIKSVGAGSITLTVFVGGVVLGYVARRFKKGVDKSLLAEELERSGRLAGDVMGSVLTRLNNWAERYVPKQRQLGGNVTKITVQRKRKSKDDSAPQPK